jgi:thiol-disulfide isomerase/thioredoxin
MKLDARQWLNTEPLTDLSGRVVLVQFWTYSCINWIRTLPYVAEWARKYDGLVVIGAHAPEFSFEHDLDNVRWAAGKLGVEYPIVIDNDFSLWRAFDNHYWPALYLVDGTGHVRYQHFGEGSYGESEAAIQRLLEVEADLVDASPDGLELAADWENVQTPETYVGDARGENRSGDARELNEWSLSGDWTVTDESARLNAGGGSIAFRFHARDLNLVLTGASPFRVTLDGEPPGDAHGLDVDEQGEGTLSEPRMYQLIRQPGPVADRTFEITFAEPGAQAYVFTFG